MAYRWGDGKGKVHSISLKQHRKNVRTSRRAKAEQKDFDAAAAPRGLSDIRRDAATDSNLRYGGEERALGLQQAQVPAWFAAYRGQVAGVAQGVNAGYQKAVDEQRAAVAAQQTQAGTDAKSAQASAQADAASRGATADPSVAQKAVQGANVNAQAGNDLVGLLSAQQTATGNYYGGLQAAGSAAELGANQQVARNRTSLASDKGLYQSQYVSDARDKEHTKRLELKAYGLDVAKAKADAQDDAADNRRAAADSRRTRRAKNNEVNKYGYTNKEWSSFTPAKRQSIQKKLGPSGTGTSPAKTPKLTAKGLDAKVKIRSGVKQLRDHDNGLASYWQGAYDELTGQNGIDPVVARAMIQGARHGRLGPKTLRALREDYGIDGLKFGKPKKRRKPSTVPDNAHGY